MRDFLLGTRLRKSLTFSIALFVLVQVGLRSYYRAHVTGFRTDLTGIVTPQGGGSNHLVVVFHGMHEPSVLDGVRGVITEAFPEADVLAPRYGAKGLSNEDPVRLTQALLSLIDHTLEQKDYTRITFVGFSMGALLARKTMVCAATACDGDYGGRERVRAWANRVDRLVLLAGMNRGWASGCERVVAVLEAEGRGYENDCRARYLSWGRWAAMELGQRIAPVFGVGRLLLSARRGAPFVANLRLEWLDLERNGTVPPVVQLVGTTDDLVSRDDQLDLALTNRFVFLSVDKATHESIVDFTGEEGAKRRRFVFEGLSQPTDTLRATFPQPAPPNLQVSEATKRVVIILHGIRDDGRWAEELGQRFKDEPGTVVFYKSYGYFSALHFLMPTRMNANVRWFVDQYTQLRATYPNARFDFIGHSNGTYMLAQSLARYHAVKFNRVAFAGSVVRTGFGWSIFHEQGRLGVIRNYRASNDLVVAALPTFFEKIRGILEVGGAGVEGFSDSFARQHESRYFAKGGHGAALDNEGGQDAIVRFLNGGAACEGQIPCDEYELPEMSRTGELTSAAFWAHRLTVFIWFAVIGAVGAFIYWLSRRWRRNRPARSKAQYVLRSAATGAGVLTAIGMFLRFI